MKILTGTQFKALDLYTIEHEPVPSIDLMERAAQEMTVEIMKRWGRVHPVCIFAGPGNNGGDGLAVARLLGSNGYRVRVWLFNVKGKLSPDCKTNCERMIHVPDVELHEVTREFDFPELAPGEIVIDALFGTGLSQPLAGGFAQLTHKINASGRTVVSLDVPSGLLCEDNTYNDRNSIVRATLTLTVQLPKLAFLFAENEPFVGEWKCLDIGLSREGLDQMATPWHVMEEGDVKPLLRQRPRFAHKGTMGHALLVAGSAGMAGAAILAARTCMRSGVGKVSVHTPRTNMPILQQAVPEAIVLPDSDTYCISQALPQGSYSAVGIGPGLGRADETELALSHYLTMGEMPMVVDADGINMLNGHPDWVRQMPKGSIFTPHPRELEALVGRCTSSYERLTRTQQFCERHHHYVVIKGHYSAICMPDGHVLFCPKGNPGMATAGSGDVLAGLLTGLLAQGYTPCDAVQLGVWLHGLAGDFAAAELGEECMMASDIIAHLPEAFRAVRL